MHGIGRITMVDGVRMWSNGDRQTFSDPFFLFIFFFFFVLFFNSVIFFSAHTHTSPSTTANSARAIFTVKEHTRGRMVRVLVVSGPTTCQINQGTMLTTAYDCFFFFFFFFFLFFFGFGEQLVSLPNPRQRTL